MDDRDAQARIDAALVEQAVRGDDTRAFEILVRRHQGMVRAQLRRLLRDNWALADDLAQETFVLAWRKLGQFRGESRFSTWLYRIAHSCFQQHWRNKGWRVQQESALDDEDDNEILDTAATDPALGLDLDAALRLLSDNQQAALLYCVQLELSHEEAALVLNMPLGSVKTHVARGKAKLRQLLQDRAPPHQLSN
ncbi:MAG: sigma-70 family RNA polymerase sigma factor [Rhodanobacteraceae bacterium]|nr:sigma-70 family RNA polymerase sigma factor [Rhodanobacteraceae bacterium]